MADLGCMGDGVQVGGRCGVAGGSRRQPRDFGRGGAGSAVGVEGGDALQSGSRGTVDEGPGGLDCCVRARIGGDRLHEDRQDVLGVPDHVARHDPQFVHGEVEIPGDAVRALRHVTEA